MKLFRDDPPDEIDEFFHQKQLDDLKFSYKKIIIFSVIAFIAFAALILARPEKFPNGGVIQALLLGGASIFILLVGVSWYSRFMQNLLSKIWQWRKNR